MNTEELLRVCAENFVLEEFRARFAHEAMKKPGRLNARVSHRIETVFDAKFRNGRCEYGATDECMVFFGTRVERSTWAMASKQFGCGGGILVVGTNGRTFYAESEGEPVPVVYAGNS